MAKEGRVGLGLWDRLVLFVAWVVTCGLVYVLGFYVGQGTQERRLGTEERVVRLPVTSKPPPEGQRPKADSDLTFYDTLGAAEREGLPADRPSATPPSTVPRVASPPPKATPPPSAPKTNPPAAKPSAAAPPVAPPVPKASAAPPSPVRPVTAVPVAPVATRPALATIPAEAPSPGAGAPHVLAPVPAALPRPAALDSSVASTPGGHGWTVQANPTRNHDEAETLYRQLRGKGYDATLVRVVRDGDTWYRVQVGRFATSAQATETMQRLREHEGVAHVFVASE